jgi:RNA polymerase sigma-32 factor
MAESLDPALSQYINLVHSYPQLSREEEVALMERWLTHGDVSAREQIARAHLRYVVAIALKYRRYGVPLAELISEGNFGIVHALGKFEPNRGTRFVTYAAYWIRAYVLNYVIRSWSMVGAGSGALRSKMFFKLRRDRARLLNQHGDPERVDAILAQQLGISETKLGRMLRRLDARDVSLDTRVFQDSSTSLVDQLVAPEPTQETAIAEDEVGDLVRVAVREALTRLDHRERFIVEKRLMSDREDELSLAEIGRHLGVSRERARQLEARAKRKLRANIAKLGSDGRAPSWLDTAA